MNTFKIETKIKAAEEPLQDYQVDFTQYQFLNIKLWKLRKLKFQSGKVDDFEIICRDGRFGVHLFCLYHSDFLHKQYKARQNFADKGKGSEITDQ